MAVFERRDWVWEIFKGVCEKPSWRET